MSAPRRLRKRAGPGGGAILGDGVNRSMQRVRGKPGSRASSDTVLTTWDDMMYAGMAKAYVENAYQDEYGTKPDEVHINDDFCKQYGWLSYNQMGNCTYDNVSINPSSHIAAERILTNDRDDPFTQTITISVTESDSATMQVTNSSELSMGSSISVGSEALGLGGEFTQNFTISNESGSSSTQTTEVTISDQVTVTIPPHSKVRVYLEVSNQQRTQNWEIPTNIDPNGLTGAQFPKQVDGHYYWAAHHKDFFTPPFNSKLSGTLTAAYDSQGHTVVEPADPI